MEEVTGGGREGEGSFKGERVWKKCRGQEESDVDTQKVEMRHGRNISDRR